MVQSLEQYVAEATNAYKPAKTAIQNQMDALNGQLETTNQQINRNYAQQQAGLNRQRNEAAEAASMQAAGSGGSFGGAANLANRKYYNQTFVPAVTQMRTNQSNDLAQARQNYEDRRTNYDTQLANLDTQANAQALAQYYQEIAQQQARDFQAQQAELERKFQAEQNEQNRQATLTAQREANEANRLLMEAYKEQALAQQQAQAQQQAASQPDFYLESTPNQWGGYNWVGKDGGIYDAATVAASAGGDFTTALRDVLDQASMDTYSSNVLNEIDQGYQFAKNNTGKSTGNVWYDTLGIIKTYDPYAQNNSVSKTNTTTLKINPSLITRGLLQTNGRNR